MYGQSGSPHPEGTHEVCAHTSSREFTRRKATSVASAAPRPLAPRAGRPRRASVHTDGRLGAGHLTSVPCDSKALGALGGVSVEPLRASPVERLDMPESERVESEPL